MQDFLIGRQQITDRDMNVFAYELLFRDSSGRPPQHAEATQASNEVIVNTLVDEGLERIVGPHMAFINFTRDNLLNGTAQLLPKEKVVIEVLETVAIDDSLVTVVKDLAKAGYTIALDDFAYSASWMPLIQAASIIKLDVLNTTLEMCRGYISNLGRLKIRFLAEKVETEEQFNLYRDMGCYYFQGYWLSRPKILQGRRMGASHHALIRLLAEINRANIGIDDLAKLISADAGLSYKLLRYINHSSLFRLPRKVTSIHNALFYLGLNEARRWANLMALAAFPDSPKDTVVQTLARAKMCELLASTARCKNTDEFFMVGLLSMLDKLMSIELETVLSSIPLADEVTAALLNGEGELGEALICSIFYEGWKLEDAKFQELSITEIGSAFHDGLLWANDVVASLGN